jgi:hypothetical protein
MQITNPQQVHLEKCDVCTNAFVVRGNPVSHGDLLCDYCWAKEWGEHFA